MKGPEDPDGALLADDRELHLLPLAWNDTAAPYPSACIDELFEAQAEQTPSAPAMFCGRHRLTYQNLNRRANQLAHHLRALGVTRETLVGVCVERSLDMIVALLGILKAGGAYVPLDPAYPAKRLAFMIEDSGVRIVVSQEHLAGRLPDLDHVVCVDRDRPSLNTLGSENPPRITSADDAAYVIYTSGTTGQPKGVIGLHRGAVNRFAWMWRTFPFDPDDVCCQKTSLNFVDSVAEIFVPLLHGVPAVIVPDETAKDPPGLVHALATSGVTRLVLVPSLLRDILALDDLRGRLAKLKICVSSGEALSIDLCRRFYERLPEAILLNLYGSTEVAADVSYFDTSFMPPDATAVPLGRPIDNTQIYIVDENLQAVPAGVAGELYVAGDGLARGYLNRPDLTDERFVPNPHADVPGALMYKTGDLGRYLPDGNIEFLGRLDRQVKIRGFRVELDSVEAHVAAHPDVAQAAVVALGDDPSDVRLVAYVVLRNPATPSVAHLRGFCRDRLPEHMVPSAFVALYALPLTPSGKIDYISLPAPEPERSDMVAGSYIAPRTAIEHELVAIWEETLGVKQIGITDDFFELGGHSLLAVRVSAQIEKLYGRRLAVSVLAKAPTVERLAAILAEPEAAQPWSPLIDLQPRGMLRPFFLVHGIGGEVLSFALLAQKLGPDQPVYGVRAVGSDGVHEPLPDVERMAATYIEAVRAASPEGPYLIGGYSSGGTVALEMARQLRAHGDEVALLAIIDSEAPIPAATRVEWWSPRILASYLANLASWVVDDDFFRSSLREKIARLRSKGRLLGARLRAFASRRQPNADIRDLLGVWSFPDQHRAFLEVHAGALAKYRAHAYDGPITLIRARTLPLNAWLPRDLGWKRLAHGGLEVYVIAGAHDNILTEPRVRVLAARLKACLNSAHARIATVVYLCGAAG